MQSDDEPALMQRLPTKNPQEQELTDHNTTQSEYLLFYFATRHFFVQYICSSSTVFNFQHSTSVSE